MLLPIVAMYYKMYNYKKAGKYLEILNESNSELLEFFYNMDQYDEMKIQEIADAGIYARGSKEEIIITLSENQYLDSSIMTFGIWIVQKLSEVKK